MKKTKKVHLCLEGRGIVQVEGNTGLVNFIWMSIGSYLTVLESVTNFMAVITMVVQFVIPTGQKW